MKRLDLVDLLVYFCVSFTVVTIGYKIGQLFDLFTNKSIIDALCISLGVTCGKMIYDLTHR